MSFTDKRLEVDFSLAQGNFQGGGNSYTARGLRMSARITTPGGEDVGNLALSIWGMTLSEMNALTVLPTGATAVGQNNVTVRAGDTSSCETIVFNGTINFAYCDATKAPDVCFRVFAIGGHIERIKPASAYSALGSSDVGKVMGALAQKMGRRFENNGISGMFVQNLNLPGALLQQVAALAKMTSLEWTLEKDVLAAWKPGNARMGATTEINKGTGMVSSPAFVASGICVTTEFQGTLKFGAKINVQSILQPACGAWYVTFIEYALDCLVPNGAWFATLQAGKLNVSDSE